VVLGPGYTMYEGEGGNQRCLIGPRTP